MHCRDDKDWCKSITTRDCNHTLTLENILVKNYCKKSCKHCDAAFLRRYPDAIIFQNYFDEDTLNDDIDENDVNEDLHNLEIPELPNYSRD